MKLLVAIPAFNESASIEKVILDVSFHLPQAKILVVDDGSTDDTLTIAQRNNVYVAALPFNSGVGSALRVAFKFAQNNQFTHVLQIDADGQHLPSEAKLLLNSSLIDGVVVGSRFLDESSSYKVSGPRKMAMKLLAKIAGYICKTKLTDVTSGFRLSSGLAINLFANDYPREYLGDTVESLIIAHRAGLQIQEVPVSMNHREFGIPSQNIFMSFWYLTRALLAISLVLLKK